MPAVIPNEGELQLLKWCLQEALDTNEDQTLKLYSNNYTPSGGTTSASFTECSFGGYSGRNLLRSSWGNPTTVSNKAQSTYATAQTWTATSSETAYGAYVVGASSGKVIWADKFPSAYTFISGSALTYTPVFSLESLN